MCDEDTIGTEDLPSLTNDLRRSTAATLAGGECHECEEPLWHLDGDLICENCSVVVGYEERPVDRIGLEREIPDDRSTHSNSGTPRCPGGFPHAYDWGGDEDDPYTFYDA